MPVTFMKVTYLNLFIFSPTSPIFENFIPELYLPKYKLRCGQDDSWQPCLWCKTDQFIPGPERGSQVVNEWNTIHIIAKNEVMWVGIYALIFARVSGIVLVSFKM